MNRIPNRKTNIAILALPGRHVSSSRNWNFGFVSNFEFRISSLKGFTMLELMVAMTIVVAASTMVLLTFHGVTRSWRSGTKLVEDLDHGDFVMDQLVLALRSAYFPDTGGRVIGYGFLLEDSGSGESARDSISWVKMGTALTTTNSPTTAGPHRVEFMIANTDDGKPAAAVRYWRPYALPEDFDHMNIDPILLSSRVTGFDCRVATNMVMNKWEWEDTWEDEATNKLPRAVELNLYMEPIEEGDRAIELTRVVEIPTAHLSWR
jgi:prepilin-type N-terminal cleavage/methylation domain-containing protein